MKLKYIAAALALTAITAGAKTPDELRIYINPGHGSWTGNDRPMQVIGHDEYSSTNTDTTGFFESNTNLYKGFGVLEKLIEMGFPFDRTRNQEGERWEIGAARDLEQNLVMSRVKNGPYEDNNTTSSENAQLYNRNLLMVATEVEYNEFDQFISIHSNAASEGSATNYHLYMYRGHNGKENVLAPGSWEMAEAGAKYSFPNPHASWSATYTYINGDIDFMGGAGATGSTNELGYLGQLAVLKHGCPGYLVEGYFHTYQPARHRAMNFDVDFIEGIQYARGVAEYFQLDKRDATGEIYGIVRDQHERFSHALYTPRATSDDINLPLNGAKAVLRQGDNVIAEYTTDQFYNGAFVFKGLQPGIYTIDITCPEYKAGETLTVEVKAGETSYPKTYLEAENYEPPTDIAYNYPDYLAALGFVAPAGSYNVKAEYTDEPIAELEGLTVKRMIVRNGRMYVLALDRPIVEAAVVAPDDQAKPTIIVYDLATKTVLAKVSTEGAAGSVAAVSDIQVTADGVLLACNATKTQYDDAQIQQGDAGRGTFIIYKWNNDENGVPAGNPAEWLKTTNSGLWYRAYPSRFAYSGTADEGQAVVAMPTVSDTRKTRSTIISVIGGEMAGASDTHSSSGVNNEKLDCAAPANIVISPMADDQVIVLDGRTGVNVYNFGSAFDVEPLLTGNEAFAGADGGTSFFRYAGAPYAVIPAAGTDAGVKLVNIAGDLPGATETTLNLAEAIPSAEAAVMAAAGETAVVRDAVSNAVTNGWINLYLLRDNKITKLTTNEVEQPRNRAEMAYGIDVIENENDYTVNFKVSGDAPEASLRLTPDEGDAVVIPLGAVVKGDNTATIDKSAIDMAKKYALEVVVVSEPIACAGVYSSDPSELTVRGGVIPVTDPEQPSFGYVTVGHGNNMGIDIYDPSGEKVATRVFKSHAMFGGEGGSNGNTNQSNPFRGNERDGRVVFSTYGDAGHGLVAVNPIDLAEEPFSLFAGEKSSTGNFVYNGINLGGGNPGFDFFGSGDDTWVIYLSEDHEGLNGKGATENTLVKQHIGAGWTITEAPVSLGYKDFLSNNNVDVFSYGTGVFVAQIREAGNNTKGCPVFGYIADILGENTVTMTSAEEGVAEHIGHSDASIAISTDGKTLAVGSRTFVSIFDMSWDGNTPKLAFRYSFPTEDHIWSHMRFDAAGNLHAYNREGGYRVYTLVNPRPEAVTPAPSKFVIGTSDGIVTVPADEAAASDAIFYNLQGVQVPAGNLTPGVYVRLSGNTAVKVLVK